MSIRTRRTMGALGAAAILSIALSGCSLLGAMGANTNDTARDEEGNVTESAEIGVFALKVGDCILASDEGEISDIEVVPCTESHAEEVYYEHKMDDGEYSDEAIDLAWEEHCLAGFEPYIGLSYEESTLDIYPITPTQQSWDELNDRVIQCVVYDAANPVLEETLKGAAR